MAYTKTTYVANETHITAVAMNNIESEVESLDTNVTQLLSDVQSLKTTTKIDGGTF